MEIRDIKGYEGLYAVTEDGKIWSYRKQKYLKPRYTKNGYARVCLQNNNNKKDYYIHRLVLMTFAPVDGMENLQVNHRNEIKNDNTLSNLEWMTALENIRYGTGIQRSAETRYKKVICVETEEVYASLTKAGTAVNVSKHAIWNCCNGKSETAGGYHWRYYNEDKQIIN